MFSLSIPFGGFLSFFDKFSSRMGETAVLQALWRLDGSLMAGPKSESLFCGDSCDKIVILEIVAIVEGAYAY
jgi:hypothetical protein